MRYDLFRSKPHHHHPGKSTSHKQGGTMTSDELNDMHVQRHRDSLLDRLQADLESRFDTTLTMLTTKADLSELKAELKTDIHGESSHLSNWMAATAITIVLGFAGMILTMLARLPHA
jgi:hypothetical protein